MKIQKILSGILAVSSSVLLAQAALASDTTHSKSGPRYGTEIVVTNFSSHVIYRDVPGYTDPYDPRTIYTNDTRHFHTADTAYKRLILSDYRGMVFFDQVVPNNFAVDAYDNGDKTIAKLSTTMKS